MKTKEIIKQLSEFEKWRYGDSSVKNINHLHIGKALKGAIRRLKIYEKAEALEIEHAYFRKLSVRPQSSVASRYTFDSEGFPTKNGKRMDVSVRFNPKLPNALKGKAKA
jgi:hypothetical protein